jgi:hypothetical protein
MKDPPWSPPLVRVGDETVAYLLYWEQHEWDGSWHAWVTWIRTGTRGPRRHVVSVRAASVRPLELPGAYQHVPRRVRRNDGTIRPGAAPLITSVMVRHERADRAEGLIDPHGRGASFWFQQMDAPRPQRSRIHIDVWCPATRPRRGSRRRSPRAATW